MTETASENQANKSESKETLSQAQQLKIILASTSPRRAELLLNAGIKFELAKASQPVNEQLDEDELAMPIEAAKKLAERKAGAVVQDFLAQSPMPKGQFCIIGADTMVTLDGQIFGKPKNLQHATEMLQALQGKTHEVITATSVWLISAPNEEDVSLGYRTFADVSRVTFKPLTSEEIADYLRKGESFDKAGAYAIQGEGANLVSKYEGELDTIIGLPVGRLLREFPDLKPAENRE